MSTRQKYHAVLLVLFALMLASCATMATPRVHLKTGDMTMEVTSKSPIVASAAFSPDAKVAASGDFGDVARMWLWDLETGKLAQKIKMPRGRICRVKYSADGETIVTGDSKGFIRFWDAKTGAQTKQFSGYSCFAGMVGAIDISSDGKYLLYSKDILGKNYTLLDTQTGRALRDFKEREVSTKGMTPGEALSLPKPGNDAAISQDGRYVFMSPRLFDLSTRRTSFVPGAPENRIDSFSTFSHDGRYILLSSVPRRGRSIQFTYDSLISLIEVSTGAEVRRFNLPSTYLTNVSFFPDKRYFISAGLSESKRLGDYIDFQTWDSQTGKMIRQFSFGDIETNKSVNIPIPAFSPDNRFVLAFSGPSLKLLDTSNGEEQATFIGFEDGEWIVITSDGYYNSSEKGAQYLSVKIGDKSYSVDSFYDVFYRPDIVAAKLRGEDIKDLITITMEDAIKSPPPVVEISPIASSPTSPKAKVCYAVKSTGGGIGEIRLFHNGKLIESDGYYKDMAKSKSEQTQLIALNSKAIYEEMRSVKIKEKAEISASTTKSKGEVFNGCKEIDAVSGENEISVTAFNKYNTVQSYMQTAKFNSTVKQEDSHLYILSIGIDQYKDNTINLKYAVKDSKDINEKILKQAATLYKPQNIHYELFTDGNATKTNITNKITELSKLIKPTDSFILFVAGHGVLLQNQYYMLTSEYNGKVNENNLISSNEIVEISKKIKSLSQLFIFDTCHAGGVDYIVSGLYDARMSVLAKKMGLHIYASANSKEAAMDGYQGNGLFTHTLLDGLNNKKEADKNKDNKISLVELGEYSKQTTTEISKKIGHQQTPLIINFGKDNPVYNLR
ncbi:MAG: caspase family protein [Thermodesulfovibrionales bacterium]|nr:caspase family protein [Thermodesulfovibrionales bacterium]